MDGLPGVKNVERGFDKFREINTVFYDPSQITIEQLETALKNAGTYRGTAR